MSLDLPPPNRRDVPVAHVETPLLRSLFISESAGATVWMKLETVQPSGSFKARGLGNLVREAVIRNAPGTPLHFMCPSGGNAGFATAYAAKLYNQTCTVCVPLSTHPDMIARIKATGARVVSHGATIGESDAHVRHHLMPEATSRGEKVVYAHPYNSKAVWRGNATLGDEIVAQSKALCFRPAAIVCAVGGGGMYNGLVQSFISAGWTNVPIVAVETQGHALLHAAVHNKVALPGTTIASSLATPTVTEESVAYARGGFPTRTIVVSDGEAARASRRFANDHHMLVEPACGAALAPVYLGKVARELGLKPSDHIVVVVCGGSNVSYPRIREWARL